MDPEKCLTMAMLCIQQNDAENASDLLQSYLNWRSSGGFEPIEGDSRAFKMMTRLINMQEEKFSN